MPSVYSRQSSKRDNLLLLAKLEEQGNLGKELKKRIDHLMAANGKLLASNDKLVDALTASSKEEERKQLTELKAMLVPEEERSDESQPDAEAEADKQRSKSVRQGIRKNIDARRSLMGSSVAMTMDGSYQFSTWWKNAFPHLPFAETDPQVIMETLALRESCPELAANYSSRGQDANMQRCRRLLQFQGRWNLNLELEFLRLDLQNTMRREAVLEKRNGKYAGCVPLIGRDLRHILHSLFLRFGQYIPAPELQCYTQLLLQGRTGRRCCEMRFIAAASLRYSHVRDGNGDLLYRTVYFRFAWAKLYGNGDNSGCFMESVRTTPLEERGVLFLFLHLQNVVPGFAAREAYYGIGKYTPDESTARGMRTEGCTEVFIDLGIRSDKFEDTAQLCELMGDTKKAYVENMREHFRRTGQGDSADLLTTEEQETAEQATVDSETGARNAVLPIGGGISQRWEKAILGARKDSGKLPLWTLFTRHGYPLGLAEGAEHRQRRTREMCKASGYTSSKFAMLGGTGRRSAYNHDIHNLDVIKGDVEQLKSCVMINSKEVRKDNYTDENAVRGKIPNDIAQRSVDPLAAKVAANEDWIDPAYEKPGLPYWGLLASKNNWMLPIPTVMIYFPQSGVIAWRQKPPMKIQKSLPLQPHKWMLYRAVGMS